MDAMRWDWALHVLEGITATGRWNAASTWLQACIYRKLNKAAMLYSVFSVLFACVSEMVTRTVSGAALTWQT